MNKYTKLLTTIILFISFLSGALAQSDKQRIDAYINQYKDIAISEMLRTGVPASIKLAQGLLETAGGQSDLASEANNHFGIKCKGDWTGDYMIHDDDSKGECFRKYPTVEESYKDHSNFLKSRPNYAFLFKLDPTDYEGWAKGLKKAGYATNPNYAQSIIKTIVENNLQEYSLLALQKMNNVEKPEDTLFETNSTSIALPAVLKEENNQQETVVTNDVEFAPILIPKAEMKKKPKSEIYPVNSIFTINEAKVIFAEAGTSLLALANNYNITLKKLIEFNDLEETDILSKSQLVFIEKKARKGAKDIHIVEEDETLRDIAQKEGIQLSVILDYNGLKKGMRPAAGERIYLKSSSPTSPKLASASELKIASNM